MTTLRDSLLPLIDQLRQIPDDFGLRRYTLVVRVRTWEGNRPGLPVGSSPAIVDTPIVPPPRVRNISQNEVNGSNGNFQSGDLVMTAITPSYGTGGWTQEQLKPVPDLNQDVSYILTLIDDGTVYECSLAGDKFERPFRTEIVLRRIAPPVRGR